MTVGELQATLAARGVTLYVKDGALRLLPKGVLQTLPTDQRTALVEHKDALLAALTTATAEAQTAPRDEALIEKIDKHLWGLYWSLRGGVAWARGPEATAIERGILGALDADSEAMALVEAEVAKIERGGASAEGADLRRVCRMLSRDKAGHDLAGAALLSAHRRWTEKLAAVGGDTFEHRAALRLMRLELKIATGKIALNQQASGIAKGTGKGKVAA